MNSTGFIVLGIIALTIINKLFSDGLTSDERRSIAMRFQIAPLWQRSGLPQYEIDRVVSHYSEGNAAQDVEGITYANSRFQYIRDLAPVVAGADGLDVDEEVIMAAILSTQSLWEVYWLNKMIPAHGSAEELGAIMESSFDEHEWVPVVRHLLNLPEYAPPV